MARWTSQAARYLERPAAANRVFWVVDNGSSHSGQASVERLERAYRNLRLIHLPFMPAGSTRSRSTTA
jgi:hypothetical protein